MGVVVERVQLKDETRNAFDDYILAAEHAMAETATADAGFLWAGANPERLLQLHKGAIVADYWGEGKSKRPLALSDALIHDWVGAMIVSGKTVKQVVVLLQDYPNHKNIYKPEVIESSIVSRTGDSFQVHLRLLKKKMITVVLDTQHDVLYSFPLPNRGLCTSHSTEIVEVEHAGTPKESKAPPDTGYGFLWRLYSYWRFEETEAGVVVECRAISLSREVPAALAWAINPIVRKLPKESLIHTLDATRKALAAIAECPAQPSVG